jgi:transcription termination/antitermination protein NusA
VKISHVIEELVEERSLEYSVIADIICEGLLAAYKKKYPEAPIKVSLDKKKDEVVITTEKTVVNTVQDDLLEIGIRKARVVYPEASLGQVIEVPFEGPIGRIEILKAKQVIAQRIRTIEANAIYKEFKPKEGTLVVGIIHKAERNGVTVKLGDTLAFLPKSLMIPGDKCVVGYTIRALLKEVLPEPRNDNQLILDRSSSDFLLRLLELEIPEIYEKLVEVKKAVRIAGYKSKIVVVSHDKNIDPVGTCIGFGGARIKPILRELGTEKIDVMGDKGSLNELLVDALKPAEIKRVQISGAIAQVWVSPDQRSLAIGKLGQNIRLASELTGLEIHLAQDEGEKESVVGLKPEDETIDW